MTGLFWKDRYGWSLCTAYLESEFWKSAILVLNFDKKPDPNEYKPFEPDPTANNIFIVKKRGKLYWAYGRWPANSKPFPGLYLVNHDTHKAVPYESVEIIKCVLTLNTDCVL